MKFVKYLLSANKFRWVIASLSFFLSTSTYAQKDAQGNAYFKNEFIQAAISSYGCYGSSVNSVVPAGYYTPKNTSGRGKLGFICSPARNWPFYYGDFMLPGDPYDAFSVTFTRNGSRVNRINTRSPGPSSGVILPLNPAFTYNTNYTDLTWSGRYAGEFDLKCRYVLNGPRIIHYVTIKNTSVYTYKDVYFVRAMDPDQENGSNSSGIPPGCSATASTYNVIQSQANGTPGKVSWVTANGYCAPSSISYYCENPNSRVSINYPWRKVLNNPVLAWGSSTNGIYVKEGEYSATLARDWSLELAILVGDLAPGESKTVDYEIRLDQPPVVSFTGSLSQAKKESETFTYAFKREHQLDQTIEAKVRLTGTSPGTTAADFVGIPSLPHDFTVLFGPNETSKNISLTAACDVLSESTENFKLEITYVTSPYGGMAGYPGEATGSIVNVPFSPGSIGSNQSICSGDTPAMLTNQASASGGIGTVSYQWQRSSDNTTWSIITSATGASYSPPSLTTTTYFRRVALNCGTLPSNVVTINVNPRPIKPIITTTGNSEFCAGGSVQLTAPSSNNYQWYKNGVLIFGATSQTYTVLTSKSDPSSSTVYTVKVKNASGCESNFSDPITVVVNALPAQPVVNIVSGSTTFCDGENVVLRSSIEGNSYQWYKGAGAITGANSRDYTVTTAGFYSVTVTNNKNCTSEKSPAQEIKVLTKPTATISGSKVICQGDPPASLSISFTGAQPWSITYTDGSNSTTIHNITTSPYTLSGLLPLSTKTYTITKVSDNNGCENTGTGSGTVYVQPCGFSEPMMIWLKADAGVDLVNTDQVSKWHDQSGSNSEDQVATTIVQPVILKNKGINFNPSVVFDGGASHFLAGTTKEAFPGEYTVFAVSKKGNTINTNDRIGVFSTRNVAGVPGGDAGPGLLYMHNTNNPYYAMDAKLANSSNTSNTLNMSGSLNLPSLISGVAREAGSTQNSQIYLNGKLSTNTFTPTTINTLAKRFEVGGRTAESTDMNKVFEGEIAEVIYFSTPLTVGDMNKTGSYLAIKYGIALTNNYLASDASIIWSQISNNGYRNEIAGIGLDVGFNLDQRISRNENPGTDIITIAHGNPFVEKQSEASVIASDKSYFVWGNNNGAKNFSPTVSNNKYYFNRIWKAQNTGTGISLLSLRFEMGGIILPTNSTGEVVLLISNNPAFPSGSIISSKSANIVAGKLTYEGVTIPSGAYFTLVTPSSTAGKQVGVSLWLKADKDLTGNPTISSWKDQSVNADIYQAQNSPSRYQTNDHNINFNPLVRFSGNPGSKDYFLGNTSIEMAHTYVVGAFATEGAQPFANSGAVISDSESSGYLFRDMNDNNGVGFQDQNLSPMRNYANKPKGVHLLGYKSVPPIKQNTFYLDGVSSPLVGDVVNSYPSKRNIGALGNPINAWFQGDVSEIIAFADTLDSENKRLAVESYLAIKYGISTTNNYIASDYSLIWNNVSNPFQTQIAGIGRDDANTLDQRISHNVQPGKDMLTVASGTTFPTGNLTAQSGLAITVDKSYFVWGNNNQTISFEPTAKTLAGNRLYLLNRKWRTVKTGAGINAVSMQFDTTGTKIQFPLGSGDCKRLILLMSADADFTNPTIVGSQAISPSGKITFNNVTVSGTYYFTLAAIEVRANIMGNDIATCSTDPQEEFELTASLSSGETGLWSLKSISGGLASGVIISNPSNSATKVKLPVQGSAEDVVAQFRWLVINSLTGCADSAFVTIRRYAKPTAPIKGGDPEYCPNQSAVPLSATALPGHTLYWFKEDAGNWLSLGTVAPTPSTNVPNVFDYMVKQKNDLTLCESNGTVITVTVHPTIADYPDIRVQACKLPNRNVYLNSYLDTTYNQVVDWTVVSSGSPIPSDGVITSLDLLDKQNIYLYSVSNFCYPQKKTRKFYLSVLDDKLIGAHGDTVVLCKDNIDKINLNQILGVDASGIWSSDLSTNPMHPYITVLAPPSLYAGARFLDVYEAYMALQGGPLMKGYKTDPNAVHLDFSYNTPSTSCLGNKQIKLVIILTNTLL